MCREETVSTTAWGPAQVPVTKMGSRGGEGGSCGGPAASLGWRATVAAAGKASKDMTSACPKGAERELSSPGRKEPARAKARQCERAYCEQGHQSESCERRDRKKRLGPGAGTPGHCWGALSRGGTVDAAVLQKPFHLEDDGLQEFRREAGKCTIGGEG